MPTTLYPQQPADDQVDGSSIFFDDGISPTNALFPPEMSAPFTNSSLLNIPSSNVDMNGHQYMNGGHQHRSSYSSSTGDDQSIAAALFQQAYSNASSRSRLPSLSPSSQAASIQPATSSHGHSPHSHSSASPSSNLADDFLLPMNSFSSAELDMLFLSDTSSDLSELQTEQGKPGQSLFLPTHRASSSSFPDDLNDGDNMNFLQNLFNNPSLNLGGGSGIQGDDDTFDMLNLVESSPAGHDRRVSAASDVSSMFNFNVHQSAPETVSAHQQQQQHQQLQQQQQHQTHLQPQQQIRTSQQTVQPQWVTQLPKDLKGSEQQNVPIKQEEWSVDMNGLDGPSFGARNGFISGNGQNDDFFFGQTTYNEPGPTSTVRRPSSNKSQLTSKQRAANGRQASNKLQDVPKILAAAAPAVGKHNKTERRYRQKVQAAQADLRDAVPALRVLYDTSSEEQKQATDFRAPDGTVDGLGEVTRPNASAKATILIGARMYIEILQRRSAMLQRKVDELEQYRLAVAGEEDLRRWQDEFNAKEREIQAQADLLASLKADEDSFDEDDDVEEEEDEPKRKRAKSSAPKAPRAKTGSKGRKAQDTDQLANAAGHGLRVFAAFATAFGLVPSASTLYGQTAEAEPSSGGQLYKITSTMTTGQTIARLPLITAEHTSRLLARGLPAALVPGSHALVEWTWRVLIATILVFAMGPIVTRWTRRQVSKQKMGSVSAILKDCSRMVVSRQTAVNEDEVEWDRAAASVVGGGATPTTLEKLHILVHLSSSANTAYSLALLALLQPDLPFLRSPHQVWHAARGKLESNSPPALVTVLRLPLHEAQRCLESVNKTTSPIAAIAEQITLIHIYDLYSRFFVRLVDASTTSLISTTSISSLLSNLESCDMGSNLKSSAFDREIRSAIEGLPQGSPAHALGLVLIGLWGIFTGPTSGAQAALASALAAEEIKGAGAGLDSVPAMLELLYPGSTNGINAGVDRAVMAARLPHNALAVDKLALACIEYIELLTSSTVLNEPGLTRLQRLEASQKVHKATSRLRLVLTQTKFVGMSDEDIIWDDEEGGTQVELAFEVEEEQYWERGGLDSENKKFERAKERLVEVLCKVGRRAAGRASGRDEDSGLEGDLDEL
ncbi:hypothetical protein IAR55_005500 [Kwoniella newhampshirensis]|uniref:BHLH domain-containing protein n=1 Tax=Kwoniella newhampshirensis TaxID=1651941 RepID=A0AAW0YIL2_9TREE